MFTDTSSAASTTYRRNLGDGLVLRWSTPEDTENIAQLTGLVFRDKEDDPPNEWVTNWVLQLMSGNHPQMSPNDYGVVEHVGKEGNPIVACTSLLHEQWSYEGLPLRIGRPEIVAAEPAYRKRGLIRSLFEMIHARSQAEGHVMQVIMGIPHFYRQFGYEYALDLGGERVTYLQLIPKLKEGETEPYTLREATVEDIPMIIELYNTRRASGIVWAEISEDYLRYHFAEAHKQRQEGKMATRQMIVDRTGEVKGFVFLADKRWWRGFQVLELDIAPGVNVSALLPSLLRALRAYGEQLPLGKPDIEPLSQIHFRLGRSHPLYDALGNALAPSSEPPYSWYVRVADIPAFIRHIAPALEQRLAHSPVAAYSGELKLDFYRDALRLVFEQGRLLTVEPWQKPAYNVSASAGIPHLVFLQLLLGHRSLDDLRAIFPDVWVGGNESELLLKTLFPARPSFVVSL